MKLSNFLTTAVLLPLISTAGLFSQEALAAEATLELTVAGIDASEGQIMIVVFADSDAFNSGDDPIGYARVDATSDTVTAQIDGLESGPCAIKLYHDVNGNGELDTNLIGMPTEPFGFSNGAVARFGPPSFDQSVFTLEDGANNHSINLTSFGG